MKIRVISAIFLVIISTIIIFEKNKNNVVKIGFIADFTFPNVNLSENSRNGALLAIEELNNDGGFGGQHIELITANNMGTEEGCKEAIDYLLANDVYAIIGPLLSRMGGFVIENTLGHDVLVISPIVSAIDFMGLDDHFFTMNSPAFNDGIVLANTIIERGDRRIAYIYSAYNSTYSNSVLNGIKSRLKKADVENVLEYAVMRNEDYTELATVIKDISPDGLVFITIGEVASAIIQQYALIDELPSLYGSQWTKITNILNYGGRRVEGMILLDANQDSYHDDHMRVFIEKFKHRYMDYPNRIAVPSHDAVKLIYHALLHTRGDGSLIKLKKAILNIGYMDDTIEDYKFDGFGDGIKENKQPYIIINSIYTVY